MRTGIWVVGVPVGMDFQGALAVCGFDILVCGIGGETEELVRVDFGFFVVRGHRGRGAKASERRASWVRLCHHKFITLA